ncbi:hypothetical protein Y1Q_0013670 [Alligator mississippiensis]|uniref:Secreted protein n=1 Tax=Alligator mississippiensis TaxID=8496 RepID=A0A151P3N5_ALLMI|nr:hypothetical protein Y1Q_0013670 [Alligator mississippiensis]
MVLACQLMCALSLLVPKTVSGLLRSGVVHQVLWISQNVDTYKESGSVVLSFSFQPLDLATSLSATLKDPVIRSFFPLQVFINCSQVNF